MLQRLELSEINASPPETTAVLGTQSVTAGAVSAGLEGIFRLFCYLCPNKLTLPQNSFIQTTSKQNKNLTNKNL